ncbi:serine protease grass-like [Drosophila kikkawai]|uniref:Serine protease grass-like n=1 Tax=Drosophila kikkawai TaxID=30033 RepID=A0A6P4IUQ0_DROKI|nr:serine protease grass-like [Drosophila kikkawai]
MKLKEAVLLVCLVLKILGVWGVPHLLDSQCVAAKASAKVVNGQNAGILFNPWMAVIIERGQMICGGSLIHSRFVLTAAHCTSNYTLTVRLGDYDISHKNSDCTRDGCIPGPKDFTVTHTYTYVPYTDFHFHDLALLKLNKTVQYSVHIRPICLLVGVLPKMEAHLMNIISRFNITGWGRTKSSQVSVVLQQTTLHNYPVSHCARLFGRTMDSAHLCAGSQSSSTCSGDSGSPLTARIVWDLKRIVQFGVVSYGRQNCQGPTVFPNLLRYGNWIEKTINLVLGRVANK